MAPAKRKQTVTGDAQGGARLRMGILEGACRAIGTTILLFSTVGRVAGQDTTAVRSASVTYLAGASIYVSAGRVDGLIEGQELSVVRHDSTVATLKVIFLSSRQAACEQVRGTPDISVGDAVRYLPAGSGSAVPGEVRGARAPARPRRLSGPGLHGRLGGRYLFSGTSPSSGGFNQPSLDLRLDGSRLGGSPIGLAVDLRTRRTTTTRSDGSSTIDGHTRVYQAAVQWNAPGAGLRMSAGRQYLTAVTWVSLFDGGLVEIGGPRITIGAFGGTEPDKVNLGFSSEIRDFGGYFQLHNRSGSLSPWSITTGAVGSYQAGRSNREFAFTQASVSTRMVSLYALQEVDFYPAWKLRPGANAITPTSTYISTSIRPTLWLAFNGAYDNRQNVRLYRDATDPAITFDDAHRQGVWGGLSLIGHRVRVGGDVRFSDGATAGKATSYTGTAGVDQFTPLHLSLTGRATWYTSLTSPDSTSPGVRYSGQMYTARIGGDPWAAVHLDLDGGVRLDSNPHNSPARSTITWYGLDVDVSLARAWFLSLSGQREQSPGLATTLFYSSLTWRF
jgi:hypothetical protein